MGTRGCPPGSSVADGSGQNVIGSDLGSSSDQRRLPPVVNRRSTSRSMVRAPGPDETDLLTDLGLSGGRDRPSRLGIFGRRSRRIEPDAGRIRRVPGSASPTCSAFPVGPPGISDPACRRWRLRRVLHCWCPTKEDDCCVHRRQPVDNRPHPRPRNEGEVRTGAPQRAPVGLFGARSEATSKGPDERQRGRVRTRGKGACTPLVRRRVGYADHLASTRSGEVERSESPQDQGATPPYALFLPLPHLER